MVESNERPNFVTSERKKFQDSKLGFLEKYLF